MAQPYGPGYAGYPPPAYPPPYGDYGAAYHQAYAPPHADPYAAYYGYAAAQQQQQAYAPAPPPQPPAQAPPLPAGEPPPPLPPDDPQAAAAGKDGGRQAAAAGAPAAAAAAAGGDAAKPQIDAAAAAAAAAQPPTQQQQQAGAQAAHAGSAPSSSAPPPAPGAAGGYASGAYYQYYGQQHYAQPYGYGGFSYAPHDGAYPPSAYAADPAAAHGAAPGYQAAAGAAPPPAPANAPYTAPQVQHQQQQQQYGYGGAHGYGAPAASLAAAGSPAAARAGAAGGGDYSRVPPPASLAGGGAGAAGYQRLAASKPPTAIKPSGWGAPAGAGGASAAVAAAAAAAAAAATTPMAAAMCAAAQATAARLMAATTSDKQQQRQPAYVSVGGAALPPSSAAAAAPSSGTLPAALTQYVARVYGIVAKDTESLALAKEAIKALIAAHKADGTLWSTDWDKQPLINVGTPESRAREQQQQQQQQRHGWDQHQHHQHDASVFGRLGGGARRDGHRQQHGGKRDRAGGGWHDRYQAGSESDDERSNSHGSDDEADGDGDGGFAAWGKKRQRLQHQQQQHGGRGGGRGGRGGRQQQQQQQKGGRGRKQQQRHGGAAWSPEDAAKHAARSARFGAAAQLAAYGWDDADAAHEHHLAPGQFIVGTCQGLEKKYLRLTRPPLPEEVRPPPVLAAALARLLRLVAAPGELRYPTYFNDQFKAMRQDLTVQGIKDAFTVQVYEAHARAALEYGDNAEYNQCQTQLAQLYAAGLPGCHAEFGAYRLLYQSVYAAHGEGRKLLGTLRQLLGNRVGRVADSAEVAHAMQVRQALACGNVSAFFRLYVAAPRLGRRLMDAAVKQLRFSALSRLVRAHKPTALPLPFLAASLGFVLPPSAPSDDSQQQQEQQQDGGGDGGGEHDALRARLGALTVDDGGQLLPGCGQRRCAGDFLPAQDEQQGLAACLAWCKEHGAAFDQEADLSSASVVTKDCWNRLFVPVDTTKVAHGDANLDIRDFLAAVVA